MREDVIALAKVRLEDMLSFFGENAQITVTEDGDNIELTVATDGSGKLIGHRGETLRAIQYLINMIVKENSKERVFVSVDIAGYKKARAEALAVKANETADAVIAAGEEKLMTPMNAADRRLVHMALADRADVETDSVGEDPQRRVVVRPRQA